jgi:hypothetical protein
MRSFVTSVRIYACLDSMSRCSFVDSIFSYYMDEALLEFGFEQQDI